MLALGLEHRVAAHRRKPAREVAGPSERPQGWQRPPSPTRRASPGAMPTHRKAAEEVISLSSCGGSKSLRKRENETSGFFFICALERSQPRCANRRRRIQLLCSSSSMRSLARSRSLSMISLRPPTRRRRCLFSRSSSIRHRVCRGAPNRAAR